MSGAQAALAQGKHKIALAELEHATTLAEAGRYKATNEALYMDYDRTIARVRMERAIVARTIGNYNSSREFFTDVMIHAISYKDIPLLIETSRHWVNLNMDVNDFSEAVVRALESVSLAETIDRNGDSGWIVKGLINSIRANPDIPTHKLLALLWTSGYLRQGAVKLALSWAKK